MSKRRIWRKTWPPGFAEAMSPEVKRRFLAARTAWRDNPESMIVVSGQVHAPTPVGITNQGGLYTPGTHKFLRRMTCPRPVSMDCLALTVTGQWAVACFYPSYLRQRRIHGNDYRAVVRGIVVNEPIPCSPQPVGPTRAVLELGRRIALATAVLMRAEGVPVALPNIPTYRRPQAADRIRQPWMRALLTGWI
jgi:hypothetical protein